ncbi:hypothetical protein B0J13DRAFT_526832 [Dactylonectria estremocensis]|uniref:Uncharacterized protein n=1 Tax=Dactylonectria estremocensis TaxID=1079267 RepID=A0A9P9EQX1_9HYPO|nr:hypothetical protein B0J13DRAFT_526832 [Dactylonectria estremocensis]
MAPITSKKRAKGAKGTKGAKGAEGATAPDPALIRAKIALQIAEKQKKEMTEDNKKLLALYQEHIAMKDEELAALTGEKLQAMDIDMDGFSSKGADSGSKGADSGSESEVSGSENEDGGGGGGKGEGGDGGDGGKNGGDGGGGGNGSDGGDGRRKKRKKAKARNVLPSIETSKGKKKRGLFHSDSESEGTDSDPEDTDNDEAYYLDPEYSRALYSRPGPQEGGKTVGWAGGTSTRFINIYRKKRAAIYRLEKSADTASYEDDPPPEEKVSNPYNRYGDNRLDNGKYRYMKRHILGIFGVAFEGSTSSIYKSDLDLINPELVKKWRITYILVT